MTATTTAKPLRPPLMTHQRQVHDFVIDRPFTAVWLEVGGGKTYTTLTALETIRPMGHILVVAPVAIARSTWIDEIEERGFNIRTRSLIVDDNDKKLTRAKRLARYQEVFTDSPTMYFINQELVEDLVAQMPRATTADGQESITWPFPNVIIDESQAFKSHAARRFQALANMRPAISRLIELSGTPAPNGLHDLWSQIYLLDQGQALGENITGFRNRWFTPKMVPGTTTPAKWIANPGAEAEIHAAIAHLAISAQNTSIVIPELTIEDNVVVLTPALMNQYKEFKKALVLPIIDEAALLAAQQSYNQWLATSTDQQAEQIRTDLKAIADPHDREAVHLQIMAGLIQDFATDPSKELVLQVIAQNQAVLTSKLMQFASGTLYTTDPDDPATKGRYEVIHTAKLEMLEYLVRNNGGSPVLVAYHFRSDLKELLAHLSKHKIDAQAFDGSRAMIKRWNEGQIPVMLLHPASAGHGLNLQHGGRTLIWYTLAFSLEHYIQTNGRLHRTGQTQPVTIHRLITKGTQDERMPSVLAGKRQIQDDLIAAVNIEDPMVAALASEVLEDLAHL